MIEIPSHLYDDQRELELNSVDRGIARFRDSYSRRDLSESPPGQRLICDAMHSLIPQIEAAQLAVLTRRKIQGIRRWGGMICSLPAERLALITLIHMTNKACTKERFQHLAQTIGASVSQERQFDKFRRDHKDLYKTALKYVRQWTTVEADKLMKRHNFKVHDSRTDKLHVGAYLMHLAIEHCGMFVKTQKTISTGKRTKTELFLDLKPEVREYIMRGMEQFEILQPWFQPMIVPPKDWTSLKDGGYEWLDLSLVKSDYRRRSDIKETKDVGDMIHAVNALQRTAWRINRPIYDVLYQVFEADGELGGVPPAMDTIPPPMPEEARTDKSAKSKWLFDRWRVHEHNREIAGKRIGFLQQMSLAKTFYKRDALWFVWQMDWRGRMYPVSTSLHPQADDIGKALLEFAEAKPLGETGLYWLTIHLANCIGWDKDELEDKVRKVNEHAHEISKWAEDPLANRGWADADSPYRCLAAAMEWSAAVASDDPRSYHSRIPVAMDGTCNGLQHLSALGRDPVGAAATNLIDSAKPSDIYTNVAEEVLTRIQQDKYGTEEKKRVAAEAWEPHVTRKTCKRGTMTTPYGVTKQGMRTQLLTDGLIDEVPGEVNNNLNYMRDCLHESIGKVIVKGREIMDWLQECASVAADNGHACRWVTPLGFVVNQEYLIMKQQWVFTLLQKFSAWVEPEKRRLLKTRQVRGIAPNFVHSLDACHMGMSIIRMAKNGIDNIHAIHDSFGCHACHVEKMHTIVREEFVKMHTPDLLEDFRKQQPLDLPDPPEKGDFDLEEVKGSRHFVG